MAMPNRPKDVKPKAEMPTGGGDSGGGGMDATKIIIVNTVTTLVFCLVFVGANYFLQDSLLTNKLAHISTGTSHGEDEIEMEEEDHGPQRGIIMDLGDFILNLSDIKPRRYLKINVAIELSRKESDPNPHAKPSGGGSHGGHGGHGAEPVDPMKQIEQEMNQYKPAIRDAVISTLSNKTSEELSSIAGKELAKEQIKEAVDAIFAEERETLRVSFGNFIIQ